MKKSGPVDGILSVLKRKRRYSIESIENYVIQVNKKDKIPCKPKGSIKKSVGKNVGNDLMKSRKTLKATAQPRERRRYAEPDEKSLHMASNNIHSEQSQEMNSDGSKESSSEYYEETTSSGETDNNISEYEVDESNRSEDRSDQSNASGELFASDESYKSDESYTSEESDASDESYSARKKNYSKNQKSKTKAKKIKGISKSKSIDLMCSYEKMVAERKLESMAFLESLKISDVKADLQALLKSRKTRNGNTRSVKVQEKLEPSRRSKRVLEQNHSVKNQSVSRTTWSFKENFAMEDGIYEEYVDCISMEEPKLTKPISYNKSSFRSLNLYPSDEFCSNGNSFTSLTWHNSAEPLIVVAGDRKGYIAIMRMDSDASPYFFKPHGDIVSNLQFNPYNPAQLFSTSFDGRLLCGDMVKQTFSQVYKTDVTCCKYFDILSLTTYLIAQKNGKVALVDNRSRRCRGTQLNCHNSSIETVNLHPGNQNYFVTAESNGFVHLWDLRRIQDHPIAAINLHKTWNSAFFSPISGNSILATSDCDIYCFDSTHLMGDLNLLHEKKFSNFHLGSSRASWVPNSDEMFVVGSAGKIEGKIEVYNKNMELYHSIMESKSIPNSTFISAFHHYAPAFASAFKCRSNKLGRIYLYM